MLACVVLFKGNVLVLGSSGGFLAGAGEDIEVAVPPMVMAAVILPSATVSWQASMLNMEELDSTVMS